MNNIDTGFTEPARTSPEGENSETAASDGKKETGEGVGSGGQETLLSQEMYGYL